MRYRTLTLVVTCSIATSAFVPQSAFAQRERGSGSAVGGFNSVVHTPGGAFAAAPAATREPYRRVRIGVQTLYSQWVSDPDSAEHRTVGLGLTFFQGTSRVTFTLARQEILDCKKCHGYMSGVDVSIPMFERINVNETSLLVSVNPAAGYGGAMGWDDWKAFAFSVNLPVVAKLPISSNIQLIPFISPSYGAGRFAASDEARYVGIATIAGGLTLNIKSLPVKFTGSARHYFNTHGPLVFGLGLSTLD